MVSREKLFFSTINLPDNRAGRILLRPFSAGCHPDFSRGPEKKIPAETRSARATFRCSLIQRDEVETILLRNAFPGIISYFLSIPLSWGLPGGSHVTRVSFSDGE
jgi:hypothetical protein